MPPLPFPSCLRNVPEINDNFNLIKIVGRGTFGIVFLCTPKEDTSIKLAMKFLIPTCRSKQACVEIKALQRIKKHINVIELLTATRFMDQIVLVFPYFEYDTFSYLMTSVSLCDVQNYVINLLRGLSYVHSLGITHRDVKPTNFLYNKRLQMGKLIDFGISQIQSIAILRREEFRKPSLLKPRTNIHLQTCCHDSISVCTTCMSKKIKKVERAGTPGYRAPEVLMGYHNQTNAIDLWSSGVVLLSLLSGHHPFFRETIDLASLAEIISVFGRESCVSAANKLGISLVVSENCPGIPLERFCSKFSSDSSPMYVQLTHVLKKLLTVNPFCRLTADELLCIMS